ncbi:EAL domain-containing protein [Bacillus massiliigorillae]|uniref:EAL domain-containing protein n=1 Tax=Bacillus massiliigorillae TaxID=1243664 RepID=UPI000399C07B|nr:EAL domain-containing protein [Bacillus massiliigorillae]
MLLNFINNVYRTKSIYIWGVVAVLILILNSPIQTFASSDTKIVKVGYLEGYGISTINKEFKQGFVYDYLTELAKYANWKYEFIPVTFDEGLEKLSRGELDLFGPLERSEARESKFAFPKFHFGYEYGTLLTNDSNQQFFYNDFKSFNNITVGIVPNDFFVSKFKEFSKVHGFSVKYKDFISPASLVEGLKSGQVDAILVGSLTTNIRDTKIISKFSVNGVYIALNKDNAALLKEFNQAMSEMRLENLFIDADLYKKNFKYEIENTAFTREENEYVSTQPKLRVVYDPDYAPVGYYDDETDTYKGISADIMKNISEISGIEFEYIKTKNYAESVQYIENGKADLLAGYTNLVESKAFLETQKFIDVPAVLIGKKAKLSKGYTIAMPSAYKSSVNFISKRFAGAKIVYYQTVDDCIEALNKGDADTTVINVYKYTELMRDQEDTDYRMVGVSETVVPLKIGVSTQVDPRVVSILNKSIASITDKHFEDIMYQNTFGKPYKISWDTLVKKYSFYLIGTIFLIFAIIFIGVIINHRRTEKKLEKIAYTDPLTGIRNLEKFRLDAKYILENNPPEEYSILYLDVEKFKNINDTYGFKAGNDALIYISTCFSEELTKDDLFGRGSADYFLVLMKERDSSKLAEKISIILKRVQAYGDNQPKPFKLTMRCGIYKIMSCETDITSLIDKANEARKGLKKDIGKTFAYYTPDMHNRILKEKFIEESMELSLAQGEFVVYLQPKFDVLQHEIAGAEALVRWNNNEVGMLSPADFIPLFEKNGFIIKLDFYVFEKVCQKLQEWIALGYPIVPISVNVSRVHLSKSDFTSNLIRLVKKYDIPSHMIELELTESTFTENIDSLVTIMNELKQAGFLISMDDFGTGFSSLNLLKVLPVDVLKLDKSFLNREETSTKEEILVADVVRMAHHLDIKVVAEGVERMKQVAFLKSIHCDLIQGYVFAKPMPIEEFETLTFKNKK